MIDQLRNILVILVVLGMVSCELFQPKKEPVEEGQPTPIARVFDKYLYERDLEGLVTENTSQEDSSTLVEAYVKNWIRKQLMISEAAAKVNFDEADIERKILDYRYALMIYEYEKYFVNENLDKSVSFEEIEQYYNDKLDNFELKQNIIKGIYVKVPDEAPRISRLRKWLKSNYSKNFEELRSYCYSFAAAYHLEDSVWVNFDDLVKTSPIASIPDKINFLKRNRYYETADSTYLYFLVIKDYKISNEISPLEFERENIENIIINKRKIQLAKRLEDEVYNEAAEDNNFEIYQDN